MEKADVVIVGGGIIGLATAYQLLVRFPKVRLALVEKEPELAYHQTGHNSGVLHSGIYYRPGSLKAQNCRSGKRAMETFCEREGIPYEICGKVIVAVDNSEVPDLERIHQRGLANGIDCELIGPDRLKELEPHARGVRAIHVRESGMVDYKQVCLRLSQIIQDRGGSIFLNTKVVGMKRSSREVTLKTSQGSFESSWVVNCAGLYSDRVTSYTQRPAVKIVPFRGEYYCLKPEAYHLCRNMIYPVPDPAFPFLGVHFTRMIGGTVECGPNAVLAFRREGYRKFDIHPMELAETLTYPAFWRVAGRYWRMALGELRRSFSKTAFVTALQRLVPEIREEQLDPAPAGVRAQALARDGTLVDDFLIQHTERVVNVCNAPSPAATASLNIGKLIVDAIPLD